MSEKEEKKKQKEEKKQQKEEAKKLKALKKKEAHELKEANKNQKSPVIDQEPSTKKQNKISKFCPNKLCLSKFGPSKLCSRKLCPSKLCPSKLCPSKLCPSKLCPCKLCSSKCCPIISRRKSRKKSIGIFRKSADQNKLVRRSRRPKDTAFFQQRLPAWEPILNAGSVYMTLIIIGLALMIIGAICFFLSDTVTEKNIEYTKCSSKNSTNSSNCAEQLKLDPEDSCSCKIEFKLESSIEGEVFIYYSLKNFFQNHRKYVKSRDDQQLLGKLDEDPSDDCEPFKISASGKPIVPCGAIANSIFNDTIKVFHNKSEVNLSTSGIAWEWDKKTRFANPSGDDEKEKSKFDKPPNWKKTVWELEGGLKNPDLMNWMRTSALPTFRKLYRKISSGLSKGDYELVIDYNFLIKSDHFQKSVILSNISILGGKNSALGIICGTVGLICAIFGVVCLYLHIRYGKRPYKGVI